MIEVLTTLDDLYCFDLGIVFTWLKLLSRYRHRLFNFKLKRIYQNVCCLCYWKNNIQLDCVQFAFGTD